MTIWLDSNPDVAEVLRQNKRGDSAASIALADMLPEIEMYREMEADVSYCDFVVDEVSDDGDSWEIRLRKPSMNIFRISKAISNNTFYVPRAGDTLRIFGDGDGFPIRGVAVKWFNWFTGVYYRRSAIRCSCGDCGWNHPGGGPCKRLRTLDGRREACLCEKYSPTPGR